MQVKIIAIEVTTLLGFLGILVLGLYAEWRHFSVLTR
jgi:hypothetical protein